MAGLCLGRVLQLNNIPFKIFERDASATTRTQGGSLDLDLEIGQEALKIAQLHDVFRKYMRADGQAVRIANMKGEWLFEHVPDAGDERSPEIDRAHLRQIFLDVLGDGIEWNCHVKSVTRLHPGGYQLSFANGSTQNFDLVVGADGCFSIVRPLLSSARPGYTGLTFLETYLEDANRQHPKEATTVGQGSIYTLGEGNGMFAQRNSDGKIRVYAVLNVPEFWSKQVDAEHKWSDPSGEGKKKVLDIFYSSWSPVLCDLFAHADSKIWNRPIYYLPIDHRWDHVPGITLIGDAAHVMSPFAGAGANLAMLDGARLGLLIAEGLGKGEAEAVDACVKKFEEEMFERSKFWATLSDTNLRKVTKPDGAQRFADTLKALMPPQ